MPATGQIASPFEPAAGTAQDAGVALGSKLLSDARAPAIIAAVAVLLAASAFQLVHLGHASLEHGEAARLNWVDHGSLANLRWFPPATIALNKVTLALFGINEFGLRLPSALMGIGCVVVLFLLVRRFSDVWSAVCVAGVAACHPMLIENCRLAKEFGGEVLFATLICWAGVVACQELTRRRIVVFALAGVVGLSMTYTSSLVIASWLPVLFWTILRQPSRRNVLPVLVGTAVFLLLATAAWYVWLSGAGRRSDAQEFYGGAVGYGAWPASYTAGALARWLGSSVYGVMRFVLGIESIWSPLKWVIGTLELLAIAASIGVCWKRCRPLCLAALCLAGVTLVAGAMRLWPVGAIHTMTFAVPITCVFIGCGLRHLAGRLGKSGATILLVSACLVVPAARAAKRTMHPPVGLEQTRPILAYTLARAGPGDGVFLYYAARFAHEFYWPTLLIEARRDAADLPVLAQPTEDRGDIDAFADRFAGFIKKHNRVWFVFTHDHNGERDAWTGRLKQHYRLLDSFAVGETSVYLFALNEPSQEPDANGETTRASSQSARP